MRLSFSQFIFLVLLFLLLFKAKPKFIYSISKKIQKFLKNIF